LNGVSIDGVAKHRKRFSYGSDFVLKGQHLHSVDSRKSRSGRSDANGDDLRQKTLVMRD
jgi:hypothetical protein